MDQELHGFRIPVKRFRLIACEVLSREVCLLASQSPHIVDVSFLPKGLHDMGAPRMRRELAKELNSFDEDGYDAILLGYGRCNDGVVGLQARTIPLVIPRAHDCITLFFGSAQAYERYFRENPGTFFRTTGWTERDDPAPGVLDRPDGDVSASTQLGGPLRPAALAGEQTVLGRLGMDLSYQQYVDRYGKDNADYIVGELNRWEKSYNQIVYIDLGMPPDNDYAERARREARRKGLQFHRMAGNLRLILALVNGQWDPEEFLVVPPGHTIAGENDGKVIISIKY